MAQIQARGLSFSYEENPDPVFENASFNIDTDWKLGLIGRNGKGKTTLLKLLMGKYEYRGSITSGTRFDYFPYPLTDTDAAKTGAELSELWKNHVQLWQVLIQLDQLKTDPECLYRPFFTLSFGEQTKVMLAVLFASENEFLLIDEPTNHLDESARNTVKEYLSAKKGFILVSHDRDLLDHVCDHMLVLNRETIEVQSGNFSSWQDNKEKQDTFHRSENEKHLKEMAKLKHAADKTGRWAEKSEGTKIGFDPVKDHDRSISARAYIGGKTKKLQARVKSYEARIMREMEEKEGLLKDIEKVTDLQLRPLSYHKEVLVDASDLSLKYPDAKKPLFENLRFQIKGGDRVCLAGENGCGKSSILKAILKQAAHPGTNPDAELLISGRLMAGSGVIISYVNQNAGDLSGSLKDFVRRGGYDESLFLAVLRQLDLTREQFSKRLEDYSEGQKKKVLIAASLITPAHLYIWDEPLNYIDVFSRMQLEKLILNYKPTLLFVEHDVRFREKIATEVVRI